MKDAHHSTVTTVTSVYYDHHTHLLLDVQLLWPLRGQLQRARLYYRMEPSETGAHLSEEDYSPFVGTPEEQKEQENIRFKFFHIFLYLHRFRSVTTPQLAGTE